MQVSFPLKLLSADSKDMSNGMRNMSRTPLSLEEIAYVKSQIQWIEADESVFVFNDEEHITESTCYNVIDDKIYVTRNVFPDDKYGSTHPRDIMSVRAVLAHEYYGHRAYRDEYLNDFENDIETTPYWEDECRASITAAKTTPNLTDKDKADLVQEAVYRARECGFLLEMDEFMKEAAYGYSSSERNISRDITPLKFISEKNTDGNKTVRKNNNSVSKMRRITKDYDDFSR